MYALSIEQSVAPLVGAWIEMLSIRLALDNSHVAPLVGAWIEIRRWGLKNMLMLVAPLVGAWIEIRESFYYATVIVSLPSWERGLKYVACKGT